MCAASRIFILLLLALAFDASACSEKEYEQCWRLKLPFGAEAKDCKCLPTVDLPPP